MTAQEIRDTPADARTDRGWLREIALQLAMMNEARLPPASNASFASLGEPYRRALAGAVSMAEPRTPPAEKRRK